MLFLFWNRGRGTDYLIHVYSVLMPDEEGGGREGKEDGDRECYLLLFFFGFGFGFGFSKREGAGIREIGSVHSFLIGSGLRLGWE